MEELPRRLRLPSLIHYKWWIRITCYIFFLLCGQSAATLLGRLYYDKGGNSKWLATFVQSAGFPILIPLLFFIHSPPHHSAVNTKPKHPFLLFPLIYLGFGLLLTADNLMYSYGLLYLPVSTYSLLCATQLAFNAVLSFFINKQKFTMFILNSLVLLTLSASLLAVNSESDSSSGGARSKYAIGFLTTVGASAGYSLYLSLLQLTFDRLSKKSAAAEAVVEMQFYPSAVATAGCVVGLFASGEWKGLEDEMKGYRQGKAAYLLTLIWTAIGWQVSSLGLLGLVYEVSSLFSNVISTLALPAVPILAVVIFGDKMDGVKAVAMVLAVWGFVSYIYQHYLDDRSKVFAAAAAGGGGADGDSGGVESRRKADQRVEMC
ncbi:Probable purine permease 10 [Linum grandiflorum]